MKKILKLIRHILKNQIVNIITFSILITIIITQQIKINNIDKNINKVPDLIKQSINSNNKNIDKIFKENLRKINNEIESTNAKVDIIDNSINSDQKRRVLIKNIRTAIIENTNLHIGVRDLNRIANAIIDYGYEFNLTIPQILAQIKVESNFNLQAKSSAGAEGLMQIMPKTFDWIRIKMPNTSSKLNPWNIQHNIRAGCFYMSELIEEFGTYKEALRAYNWGPTRLKKFNAGELRLEPDETLRYVPKIQKYIEVFKKYGLE